MVEVSGDNDVDLALSITDEIGIKINAKTPKQRYYYFKDITLYIYEKNGIKTIGIWDYDSIE